MTIFAGPYYLVADDGTHCYPLRLRTLPQPSTWGPSPKRAGLVIPGGCRTATQEHRSYGDTVVWLLSPSHLEHVEVRQHPKRVSDGWALKDQDAASEKFPPRLTDTEWAERGWEYEDDSQDAYMANRLYQQQTREVPTPPVLHPTRDLTRLDGAPDEHPTRPYAADAPASLIYGLAYHHLLPGAATGLREAVHAALVAEFGPRKWLTSRGVSGLPGKGSFDVGFELDYDVPQWKTPYHADKRKRPPAPVRDYLRLTVPVNVPTDVRGLSKADAYAAFDTYVADVVAWVRSHRVTVCSHCRGEGVVTAASPAPTKP